MPTNVWIVADTLGYLTGAGHLWTYLNWALGMRGNGCDVTWLEPSGDQYDPRAEELLAEYLAEYGIERLCVFDENGDDAATGRGNVSVDEAPSAELLLNLAYHVPRRLLERCRACALLDIDPGMSQSWFAEGDIELGRYDVYLTTGEGVASGRSPVPDTGVRWQYAPPCVALDAWLAQPPPDGGRYTTITHWWEEGFTLPDGSVIDNSKRAGFMPYVEVPARAEVPVELAASKDDLEEDAMLLHEHGWSLAEPEHATETPRAYQSYIRGSRGEFSCAKPAYVALDTGWISDRTVCYLATGRPAVVEHTGPCSPLDEAEGSGVFRFRDPDQAVAALTAVEDDHSRQCALARELAEARFDAEESAARVLELCLR
jgi:hypothetical protein